MKIIDNIFHFLLYLIVGFCLYAAFGFEDAVVSLLCAILFRLAVISDAMGVSTEKYSRGEINK